MEGMSESLLTFLQHLREFGLVFQRKVETERERRGSATLPSSTISLDEKRHDDPHGLRRFIAAVKRQPGFRQVCLRHFWNVKFEFTAAQKYVSVFIEP